MSAYFITGIGTGVGKTLVSAALAWQMREAGRTVQALKPVISGFDADVPEASDSDCLAQAQGLEWSASVADALSPWRFVAPLSPHVAAAREGRLLVLDEVVGWCEQRIAQCDGVTLIEGVGGVMVPLNDEAMVLDWMTALSAPVVLVAASYLGAMNHTLLSVEVLQRAGLRIAGVVVSESAQDDAGLVDMVETLRSRIDASVAIVALPRVPDADAPWKYAPNLLSVLS